MTPRLSGREADAERPPAKPIFKPPTLQLRARFLKPATRENPASLDAVVPNLGSDRGRARPSSRLLLFWSLCRPWAKGAVAHRTTHHSRRKESTRCDAGTIRRRCSHGCASLWDVKTSGVTSVGTTWATGAGGAGGSSQDPPEAAFTIGKDRCPFPSGRCPLR